MNAFRKARSTVRNAASSAREHDAPLLVNRVLRLHLVRMERGSSDAGATAASRRVLGEAALARALLQTLSPAPPLLLGAEPSPWQRPTLLGASYVGVTIHGLV